MRGQAWWYNRGAKEKGWIAPHLLFFLIHLSSFWAERGLGLFLFNHEYDQTSKSSEWGKISRYWYILETCQIVSWILGPDLWLIHPDLGLWHWGAVGKINVTSLLPGQAAGLCPACCLPSSPRTLAQALLPRQSLYQQRSSSFLVLSMENAQRVEQGDFYWIHWRKHSSIKFCVT